ncbi:hypothetical protein COCNU_scaffold142611G000010 [Cocos nucifera]|nr:hypothetical protein [Cocos nucifera]
MPSKGLQTHKRKDTASDEPISKKARVNTPSSTAPADVVVATEVAAAACVSSIVEGSMPPSSMSPPAKDPIPWPPTKREEGEKKKMKLHHKACLTEELKARKDLQAEVDRFLKKKAVEVEGLQEMLRKKDLTSMGLKAALALEEERRKKAEVKVGELKDQNIEVDLVDKDPGSGGVQGLL